MLGPVFLKDLALLTIFWCHNFIPIFARNTKIHHGIETVKRFVKVHFHCIISNLKRVRIFDVDPPPGRTCADAHGCTDFDLNLWSWSVMLFGSYHVTQTINVKLSVSLTYILWKRSNQSCTILTRSLKTWETSKGVFWYSSVKPRGFTRFAQWLIRPWLWCTSYIASWESHGIAWGSHKPP